MQARRRSTDHWEAYLITIQGRGGVGQEFELEFQGYLIGSDHYVNIPESKTFQTPRLVPGAAGGQTTLRWSPHSGQQRLVIDIAGKRMLYDDAPEAMRKALIRWVERLAVQLRKGRYED